MSWRHPKSLEQMKEKARRGEVPDYGDQHFDRLRADAALDPAAKAVFENVQQLRERSKERPAFWF